MPSFTATPQSSTAISVSWNLLDVDPGFDFDLLQIVQSDPLGNQTQQSWSAPDAVQEGTTVFNGLKADMRYSYTIYAVWDDGAGGVGATFNNNGVAIVCTTKAAVSGGGGTGTGTGSGTGGQVSIYPGPIPDLTLSWDTFDYSYLIIEWTDGANTESYTIEIVGTDGEVYKIASHKVASNLQERLEPSLPPSAYTVTITSTNSAGSRLTFIKISAPPPKPVANLEAKWINGYRAVQISWAEQANSSTPTAFTLRRYPGAYSASATPEETVAIPATSPYTDIPANITGNSIYQYQLVVSNANGQSVTLSNILAPPQAPGVPQQVVAQWLNSLCTEAGVNWDPVENADSYEVTLYAYDVLGYTNLDWGEDHKNITATSFQEGLIGKLGIAYQYQVIAHNRFGSSSLLDGGSYSLYVPDPVQPVVTVPGDPTAENLPHHIYTNKEGPAPDGE